MVCVETPSWGRRSQVPFIWSSPLHLVCPFQHVTLADCKRAQLVNLIVFFPFFLITLTTFMQLIISSGENRMLAKGPLLLYS